MILINLEDWQSTAEAYPRLREALEWLVQRDRQGEFTVHREELSDGAYANFERPAMRIRERAHLEVHRIYIDIHVPLSDDESIGWAPTRCCRRVLTEYDHAKDIAFYGGGNADFHHYEIDDVEGEQVTIDERAKRQLRRREEAERLYKYDEATDSWDFGVAVPEYTKKVVPASSAGNSSSNGAGITNPETAAVREIPDTPNGNGPGDGDGMSR